MSDPRAMIHEIIREKSVLKQDVFTNTLNKFSDLKEVLKDTLNDIQTNFEKKDPRVEFNLRHQGDFQSELKIAGDVLIFQMHTNVFQFDSSHNLWRSGYLKEDDRNSYVGIINIYNFLADSFKYQRVQDVGYLIGRIFINREDHFMVQGKRQLGYLYNDFINSILDREAMTRIVDSSILYTLDFDLLTPPYENMQVVTVEEIQSMNHSHTMATGKRLGFQFNVES
jgi:hypothetical protein